MPRKITPFIKFVYFVFLYLYSALSQAESTVLLVSSNSHFGIVHRIEAALFSQPSPRPNIQHMLVESLPADRLPDELPAPPLIVTIGAEALEAVLKTHTSQPILSILIRKHTYQNLLNIYHRKQNSQTCPITAIYLDQPLKRQINLIKKVVPEINHSNATIGVLFGPASINSQEELMTIALEEKIKLNTIYVNNFENPVAVMDAFLAEVKVLLALPDSRIYNPRTARGILLAAFHKHVPLIGYSQSYVKNGALVSVFSNTKQIAQQAAQSIITILDKESLPEPQYPQEFSIEINYQVAKSLNIDIESESTLKQDLVQMELLPKTNILAKQNTSTSSK
tara:strand:+ start:64932 stop:65942 length:1011 start_codon:yes stop_codon:yes gene_type:complete